MTSIAATLGIGSGIDTDALVTNLAAANKAPKEKLITDRETANAAKVSSLAGLASSIDGFATALNTLLSGGSLYTQPTSSNEGALAVSPVAGGRIAGLASTLQITRLAAAQTVVAAPVAKATDAIGQGTMTLKTSLGSFTITVGQDNDSLTGLARAINGASAGVSASVLTDSTGSRLVIKGAVGAASAFTLTADSGAAAGLSAFTYDPNGASGMSATQTAQDASLVLDGVPVTRASNTVSDLIPGVKLELKATTTSAVAIGATQPVSAMRQAVIDFVDTYNELKKTLDTATASGLNGGTAGPFRGDPAIRGMIQQLGKLSSTPLVSSGAVTTLADLGVRTGNDGKLSVDTSRLDSVLASNPDDVEALFNPTQTSSSPLVQITSAIGKVAPGTYTLTNIVAGPPPSGKIGGQDLIPAGSRLVAPVLSGAGGLVLAPLGNVASATITIEAGLGGALQAIRDSLRSAAGPLSGLSDRLTAEAKSIASDREKMQTQTDAYAATLKKNFTAMDTRVTALKATQSYLEQQIKVWTNDGSS